MDAPSRFACTGALSARTNPQIDSSRVGDHTQPLPFSRWLRCKGSIVVPAYHRGNALLAMDRWQAARESYSRVLAIKPDHGALEELLNRAARTRLNAQASGPGN